MPSTGTPGTGMPIEELQAKDLPQDCFVFKHSTACPISRMAADEVKSTDFELPLYWINVIQQRDLSNWVATTYAVRHESPQLLLIKNGKVQQVWNHHEIKRSDISRKAT